MGLGDKAKEVAIEHVKQKAARDILNGIKEWRANKISTAKRRWIFELIQNAIDTAKARGKDSLKIEINFSNDSIKFKHGGGYFTLDEISAVIYGGSTKPYAPESEYIGRFGTGFLVTHIVNRKVRIKGFACEEESRIYEFEIDIERQSNDEREISENIEKCFQQLNSASPITDISELYTEFEYKIDDDLGKQAVQQALEELKKNIPFILAFNKIISEIKINGQTFKRKVQKRDEFTSKIKVNNREVYVRNDKINSVQIAVIVENNVMQSLERYPKIFIGMPLTETADYINIPFAINSLIFDSTKERDALSSDSENNKKLLESAFNEYRSLIEKIIEVEENLTSLFNVVKIKLISEEKTSQNPLLEYFNEQIIKTFQEILEKVPLVECVGGRREVVPNVIFPIDTFNASELEEEIFNDFYALTRKIKPNVPTKSDLKNWMQMAQILKAIEGISEYISLYDIKDLKEDLVKFIKAQENFPTFDDFAKNFNLENGKQFLLSFFELTEKLYKKRLVSAEFIDYLLPDQTGIIGPLQWNWGQLFIDEDISEELKDIIRKIGWEIRRELVDKDFADFKVVKDYVREILRTNDVLKKALTKDEIKLNDEELKQKEWEDKILGWIELFWWCVKNNRLLENFPVITKEKTLRNIQLNNEEILIPFKYMEFDEKYEDIYPESRIMHTKYFDTSESENIEQKIDALKKYECFITCLPLYKRELGIGYNKLNSILTKESEISKVDHTIKAEEDKISYLPFWNEIIGWVSEYQERGRLLFEFIIACLLDKDKSWKEEIRVECSCREREHRIIPSHWLASLKTDAWLPFKIIEEDKEKIEKRAASKEGIENLFSKEELDGLIKGYPQTCEFLPHFGFDELDLKIKLKSIDSGKPEEKIRKEVSILVDISEYIASDKVKYIAEQNPDALKDAIDKTYEKLRKEPIKNENRKIGENLEKIIKEIVEREGLRVIPIYKGGDLEIWPEDHEGWDSGLIEISPYLLEIKFTSGSRVHLSKTQSDYARHHKDKYVVLVVENVNDLREKLKNVDENSISKELISLIIESSYVIENIHTKLGEMPNPDEVEPDINGYWVKKRLWEDKNDIGKWLQKNFGDGV